MNKEQLEKALHDAEFLVADLREAYSKADPMASILIYDLLSKAAEIKNRISEILNAMEVHNGKA